ncbi:MAG: hypothetical protein H7240_02660 [Glaciimonas sp.]|nr:hypothetical protein [Glaciimonas sp.]
MEYSSHSYHRVIVVSGVLNATGWKFLTIGESDLRCELPTNSDLPDAQRRARIRLQLAVGYYVQEGAAGSRVG